MKARFPAILAIIALPLLAYGQSTLSFPRVMQPQDFSTTGFALVNPGAANAPVTFTLYGDDGRARGTSTQTITARGQFARLASELFPPPTAAGWVEATSTVSDLQGFWFGGDLATFADGAEAAASSTELVLPLITPGSEIDIANTGTADVTVLMNLLGTDGADLTLPVPQLIPAKGFFKRDMPLIFPNLEDYTLPSHMRITCRCANASAFAATVIARDFLAAPSWAVRNGVPANNKATTIYFPHLVEGPQGGPNWKSLLGLTNLSTTTDNDVTLTFTSESGTLVRTNQFTLPPNGGIRVTARDLFVLNNGFQSGWVKVTSTSGLPLTGYIAYAETTAAGVAVVPSQQDAQAKLLFAHIADLSPWLTGLALLNPNATAANVDVFAMTPSGALIGTASFSLPAGRNSAKLLSELVDTQKRTSDGGFVFVQSTLPLFGIELFFSRNLQVLANVPAGSGNTFVPPGR